MELSRIESRRCDDATHMLKAWKILDDRQIRSVCGRERWKDGTLNQMGRLIYAKGRRIQVECRTKV